jgi:hypothetical protein
MLIAQEKRDGRSRHNLKLFFSGGFVIRSSFAHHVNPGLFDFGPWGVEIQVLNRHYH